MTTTFELWMQSLDPAKLAKESFHSAEHREAMALHEAEKVRLMAAESRVLEHERFLTRVAELWALKDSRDTPIADAIKPRLSVSTDMNTPKKEPVFTPEQLRIAQTVLDRKAS